MEQPFIDGKNIYLRGIRIDDVNDEYVSWLNDYDIIKNMTTGLFPSTHENVLEYINNIIKIEKEIMFAIIYKKEQKHIGNIKLGEINWIHRHAYLGIMIGNKNFWGKGYGREACDLLLWYAFNRLNLHKLSVALSDDNPRAINLYKKLGFQIECNRRKQTFKEGRYHHDIIMGILEEEYFSEEKK